VLHDVARRCDPAKALGTSSRYGAVQQVTSASAAMKRAKAFPDIKRIYGEVELLQTGREKPVP